MKPDAMRVLLTGAAGGIGRAAAEVLVTRGASVMLTGRRPAGLHELAARLGRLAADAPGRVTVQVADLASTEALTRLARAAADWGANGVVHAAGVPGFGRLASLPSEALGDLLHTNLLAPMLLTQALLPHLSTQPEARVVFVGSVLGRLGLPGYSAYCASKFGLRGFAEALRRELAGGPVKVQYLGPRATQTGFNSAEVRSYNQATGTASDPPERVAEALLALMSAGQPERFTGFPESFAVRLNGLAPSLLDGAFAKHRQSLP